MLLCGDRPIRPRSTWRDPFVTLRNRARPVIPVCSPVRPLPFRSGPRKAAFPHNIYVLCITLLIPIWDGSGVIAKMAYCRSPFATTSIALMNAPRPFGFILFAPMASSFPRTARHTEDGPRKDVAQNSRRLWVLLTARWLPVYPRPLRRAGPPNMALKFGPSGHPAWVQIPEEMQPSPSAPLNSSTPRTPSELSSPDRRCLSTYQFTEAGLPPIPHYRQSHHLWWIDNALSHQSHISIHQNGTLRCTNSRSPSPSPSTLMERRPVMEFGTGI